MNVARCGGLSTGRIIGLSLLFLAGASLRCSSNPVPKRTDPCTTVYAGQCGGACTTDAECSAGLHCAAGQCAAQCGVDASLCAADQTCTSDGRCQNPPTGSAGKGPIIGIDASPTDDGGTAYVDGDDCPNIDLQLGQVTPTVVLLIDQSDSMADSDIGPGGGDRWQALKDALTGPGSVIQTLQDQVRFGFAFYSNELQLDEPPELGVCPMVDKGGMTNALMPPALNRFDAFNTYFTPLETFLNTPTAESFELVAEELAAFAEPGPKFIVLATDGEPDRCEENRENADLISREMVVTNVQNAYQTMNISTFVISVGDDVAQTHLNDVANVGQGFPVDLSLIHI